MSNKNLGYQTPERPPTVVIIKGLHSSEFLFEPTRRVLDPFEVITIDPEDYVCDCQVDCLVDLTANIISELDDHHVQNAVFISFGIGNQLSFLIAKQRADLFQSQILVGLSNRSMDPVLLQVYEKALEYWHQHPEDTSALQLLREILMGKHAPEDKLLETEIFRSIRLDSFKKLKFLLELGDKKIFSKEELANYKIPNFIVCSQNDPFTHKESAVRFSAEIGTNRGLLIVKESQNNFSLVRAKSFELVLEVLAADFLHENAHNSSMVSA